MVLMYMMRDKWKGNGEKMITLLSVNRDSTNILDLLFARNTKKYICWRKQSLISLIERIVKKTMPGFLPKTSLWGLYCNDEVIAYVEYYRGIGYRCELVEGFNDVSSLANNEIYCKCFKPTSMLSQQRRLT